MKKPITLSANNIIDLSKSLKLLKELIMQIKLPSVVRAFRMRGIKPDHTHSVSQGQLNLWLFANTYVGELIVGESDTTSDAILITSDGAYINTTPPQEIADDIFEWNKADEVIDQLAISSYMSQLGKSTSDAKTEASRLNGKKGGRPRKQPK